jgi:hypothetical protein
MVVAFFIETNVSNSSPLSHKIGCLANPIKNSLFTLSLIISIVGSRPRSLRLSLPVMCSLTAIGSHTVLPALTNTFFTIHPPMLYVFTALTIFSILHRKRRAVLLYAAAWAVSIFMGGFWSMQELS